MAILGLFLLHLYAIQRDLPAVSIAEISPHMNFASVKIMGVLESDARPLRSGTVLYVINDGTGTIPVFLNNTDVRNLPEKGCFVEATGNLSVGAGNKIRMSARAVARVSSRSGSLARTVSTPVKLNELSARQAGTRLRVRGRVENRVEPPPGSKAPHKMTLADQTGNIEVVHWFEPAQSWQVGDHLEAFGIVDIYKGKLQLKVQSADGLTRLE